MLQPGYKTGRAGYALYGSSTVLVYTTGDGVDIFTYDPTIGEFLLSSAQIKIRRAGNLFDQRGELRSTGIPARGAIIDHLKEKDSATGHLTVSAISAPPSPTSIARSFYGGVFLYPADRKSRTESSADVRGQPARNADRAGRRAGDHRLGACAQHPAEGVAPALSVRLWRTEDVKLAQEFMAEDFAQMKNARHRRQVDSGSIR